jgi:hypothetical protein
MVPSLFVRLVMMTCTVAFKAAAPRPITVDMSVSEISGGAGANTAEALAVQRAVLTLKKQKDVQTAQAEGLIQLIQTATPQASASGIGQLISVRG